MRWIALEIALLAPALAACGGSNCSSMWEDDSNITVTLVGSNATPTFTLNGQALDASCLAYASPQSQPAPLTNDPSINATCTTWSVTPLTSGTVSVVASSLGASFGATVFPASGCASTATAEPRSITLNMESQ